LLNREIVPRWALRLKPAASAALVLLLFTITCVLAIRRWRQGSGLVSVESLMAVIFILVIVYWAVRLPSYLSSRRRQSCRTAIEAMRPDGFDDRCARCGYDLTGTTSLKCPECGAWHGRRRSTPSTTE